MPTQPTTFNPTDVRGIDISHHQGVINWSKVAAENVVFAFTKATENVGFKDSFFDANWAAMKSNNILRGAYHFFRPKADAAKQAANFLNAVGRLEPGDLPPVIDVEVNDGKGAAAIIAGVRTWVNAVEQALGRTPIVYTSASFWNANLGGTDKFAECPLWVAHYTSKPAPNIPKGFTAYTIWQFTEQGKVNGVNGNCDLNRFNGTLESLRKLAGLPG